MHTTHLLYLHGFRSSPLSAKAQTMAALVQKRFPLTVCHCPALPLSPREAMQRVMATVSGWHAELALRTWP